MNLTPQERPAPRRYRDGDVRETPTRPGLVATAPSALLGGVYVAASHPAPGDAMEAPAFAATAPDGDSVALLGAHRTGGADTRAGDAPQVEDTAAGFRRAAAARARRAYVMVQVTSPAVTAIGSTVEISTMAEVGSVYASTTRTAASAR